MAPVGGPERSVESARTTPSSGSSGTGANPAEHPARDGPESLLAPSHLPILFRPIVEPVPSVHFALLTLFPEALEPYAAASILGIAQEKGLARIDLVDFRDFSRDRHRTVDDRPFGGGPGMVLKPEPIHDCVDWLEEQHGHFHKVLLTPAGRPFEQADAVRLRTHERILLLCGRYEGVDQRVEEEFQWEHISIGDFVLAGGELPALCVTEAVTRLIPGVLGHEQSAVEESFTATTDDGSLQLDHPHYTRPRVWRGRSVPDVLLSGDHAAIASWRRARASERTDERRPDLGNRDLGNRDLGNGDLGNRDLGNGANGNASNGDA
ncbi:tRNA (guanine-N(1)-)-methyltransferase [Planctomycetes bacterium Pla163]|uniref:tRNA (guanine-N(1)-)-methyltransferase n=1 Tax=Rohdeia mirabilis TaxID=2528008 RepID=A0A518D2Z0_9BACT|nr:tRNA (guanine-N(1)-)-methyltransferase [Planctomycetes bacterium Pla163]